MTELPITLLHGWGLHGGLWAPLAESLAPRVTECPDLPGYGASPSVTPYTAEAIADRLAEAHPGPRIVLGWSMGGMAALAWAARHPEQVRALVLVGSSPSFVNRPGWEMGMAPEVLDGFAESLTGDYRATLLRFLSLQARGGDAARDVVTHLRATVFERGEPNPDALAAGLDLLRQVDLRQQAGAVRAPTLILHGGYDGLCPPAEGQWLAEHIPGARLAMHERASHAPFLSHPEWFVGVVKEFLDAVC